MATSPARRVEQLRKELNRHNYLYYTAAKPEVSDREYDALMKELADLEAAHPELLTADSPTQRVGGEPIEGFASVTHAVPMMSIDNTYDEAEVRAFDERMRRALGEGDSPAYVLEPKIDGTAVSLRYEKGVLVLAATRGRGNVGDDITSNARTVKSVPLRLHQDGAKVSIPAVLEVRGEIYMDNAEFQRVNKELADAGEEVYANPRNLTAGTLKRLDPKVVAQRKLRFLSHGLGQVEPLPVKTYWEWTQLLQKWGLPLPANVVRVETIDEALAAIEAFAKVRPTLPYQTDGMVMKVDAFAQREKLGFTSKSPRWVIAYKYATEQQPTVLKDVRWQVGKLGGLTPVGDLEPVFIGGVTVTHVTMHNVDQIRKLDVHVGDTVVVERAGEVIPQIVEVIEAKRPKGAAPVPVPEKCPACAAKLEWEAYPEDVVAYRCLTRSCEMYYVRKRVKKAKVPAECPACQGPVETLEKGIDLYCANPACPAQLKERLRWYCARGQMDIENLGDKLIDQLVDKGLVKTFADLYRLTREQLLELERLGEKSAQNIIDALEGSKTRGLDKLLAGLGVRHVGTSVGRILADRYGSLDAIAAATEEELVAIDGLGEVIADAVHDFFHNAAGIAAVADLKSVGVDPKNPVRTKPAADLPLSGKSVVVTGTLPTLKREEVEELIVKHGGKPSGSVSKKTAFVVAGEDAGSKLAKAKELGVEVLSEAAFLERVGVAPTPATNK